MTGNRKKIPRAVEAEVLFTNNRTCCVCRDSTKGVQIHHIDENKNNNSLDNLAVVCADCHDKIHKSGGITKGISANLLIKYKSSWELFVQAQRTIEHDPLGSSAGTEKILFEFEIRKIAYEIAALQDKDKKGIAERLEFLSTIYLMEGYSDQILHTLNLIFPLIVMDVNKACSITEKIPDFFLHLVGPKEVEISEKDIENLKMAIGLIGSIGDISAEFNKSLRIIKSVSSAFRNIWNILIWYNLESLALTILNQLNEVTKSCEITFEDEKPLISGIKWLHMFLGHLNDLTVEERPEWKEALAELNKKRSLAPI